MKSEMKNSGLPAKIQHLKFYNLIQSFIIYSKSIGLWNERNKSKFTGHTMAV